MWEGSRCRRPRSGASRGLDFEPSAVDEWTGVYSRAETHSVEGEGYFLREDEPDRIATLIEDFLRRNP